MKIFTVCFLAVLLCAIELVSLPHNVNAGAVTNAQSKCYTYLQKYRSDATMTFSITYYNFVPRTTKYTSKNCSYTFAQNYDVYNINGALATAKIGNNVSSQRVTISKWNAIAGNGYRIPAVPPLDSMGFAKNDITENIIFDTVGSRVVISNIEGYLSVPLGTNYGSTLIYVLWIPSSEEDSIVNSSEVLEKGKVSILSGTLPFAMTEGFLNSSDFNVTVMPDPTGTVLELKLEPIPGLSKSIPVSGAAGIHNVRLSAFSESGYGDFFESDIINPFVNVNVKSIIEGMYNSTSNSMKKSDSLKLILRNNSAPYQIIDSASGVLDSVSLSTNVNFESALTGKYYLVVKHRNSIETWSRSGGDSLKKGYIGFYDYTVLQSNAYGGNMKEIDNSPLRYAIYSGDVNQDGFIDGTDQLAIDNDAFSFVTGYVVTDLTGDDVVDASDAAIAENNAANFVSVVTP